GDRGDPRLHRGRGSGGDRLDHGGVRGALLRGPHLPRADRRSRRASPGSGSGLHRLRGGGRAGASAGRRHHPPGASAGAAAGGAVRLLHPQHHRAVPVGRHRGNPTHRSAVQTGMRSSRTSPLLGVALSAGLIVTAGCSALPGDSALTSAELRLVSFTSCDEATQELRAATLATLNTAGHLALAAPDTLPVDATLMDAAGAPAAAEFAPNTRTSTDYSGTNVHESGVDEPDLVKTDGRRIVTVHNGVLRVVDAERRVEAGQIRLNDPQPEAGAGGWWQASELLLHGDRGLVLMEGSWWGGGPVPLPEPVPEPALDAPQVGQAEPSDVDPDAPVDSVALPAPMPLPVAEIAGPKLLLVDLSGSAPTVISEYAVDGSLLDARAVGQTARVVVRSTPRLDLPHHTDDPAAQQAAIEEADVTAWLP